MVMDFTVTDPSGNSYTLSELTAQKKAVVLNFWYVECAPCNAEFPFLQEAYEQYADQIALLALNPINAPEAIDAFCEENGYITKNNQCRYTAEIIYRYITKDNDFVESHTGLEDVEIEAQIFAYCVRQHKKMKKNLWEN
jgi:thiol-disulfide isomerase/thioredoxin